MAFNWENMTDEQKAQFGAALSSNEEFKAAVEEQGMMSSQEDLTPLETLKAGLIEINGRYDEATAVKNSTMQTEAAERRAYQEETGTVNYDKWWKPDVFSSYTDIDAQAEILKLLNANGFSSAEDLKTSVSGSHNDTFMNLGIGNALYDDKSSGFEPRGGDSRDVNIEGWYGMPVGESTLVEQGPEPGLFSDAMFEVIASVLGPVTGGWSVAALKALQAATGTTLHGGDYIQAAASYVLNNLDMLNAGETALTAEQIASEQAAFEAFEAAQALDTTTNFASLGLSELPSTASTLFTEGASSLPTLAETARQAAEVGRNSGIITNLTTTGTDLATNGARVWDWGNQAYNFFDDIQDARKDSQGVPNQVDQPAGFRPVTEEVEEVIPEDTVDDGGGGSSSEVASTDENIVSERELTLGGGGLESPFDTNSTPIVDETLGTLFDGGQDETYGSTEEDPTINEGAGWEFLGGDRWQNINDGRIHREAQDPNSGSGSTKVGSIHEFPEYTYDEPSVVDNTGRTLSLGGLSDEDRERLEAIYNPDNWETLSTEDSPPDDDPTSPISPAIPSGLIGSTGELISEMHAEDMNADDLLRAGLGATLGNNPYFPNGTTGGGLTLGGATPGGVTGPGTAGEGPTDTGDTGTGPDGSGEGTDGDGPGGKGPSGSGGSGQGAGNKFEPNYLGLFDVLGINRLPPQQGWIAPNNSQGMIKR